MKTLLVCCCSLCSRCSRLPPLQQLQLHHRLHQQVLLQASTECSLVVGAEMCVVPSQLHPMTPVVGVMTIVSVLVTVAYDKISLGYDIPILSTITLGKGQCMTDYTQRPAQSREISPPLQQGVTAVGQKNRKLPP